MKLTISLVIAVLIGLCFTPAWAQDEAMDENYGLRQQVRWVAPFEFIRYKENSRSGDWWFINDLELVDRYDETGQFSAQFHLPDGAEIVRAVWYVYDKCKDEVQGGLEGNIFGEIIRVEPKCDDKPAKDPICKAQTQGEAGWDCVECVFENAPPLINYAQNNQYYYAARLAFNKEDGGCDDDDQRFAGLKIWYKLSVNPYATSPFTDIGHLDKRFQNAINSLYQAGITKGGACGGANVYCPQDNITRGEVAVFLAEALGLYTFSGAN